ncbi:hypothetical protein LSAT2_020873 [Lamellibrachia satsuma]|nr:hypothetical protein LSAT2_020873 [Lamellibrachia satsuma]
MCSRLGRPIFPELCIYSEYFFYFTELDACKSTPCKNGGACKNTGNGYKCSCKGFVGDNCEIKLTTVPIATTAAPELDPCKSTPCKNGGACKNTGNGYKCSCKGFVGDNCEIKLTRVPIATTAAPELDACKSTPCKNGGACKNTGNGYKCSCKGFVGDNCEIKLTTVSIATTAAPGRVNVELGSTREVGENTLEELPSTCNLPEQWARFKKQFKQFIDASEKSEASDKAKIAMLLRTIGDKGDDIFDNLLFEADAQPTFVNVLDKFEQFCKPRYRNVDAMLEEYTDVFSGLGCLPGEYDIVVDNSVKPVQNRPRKVAYALKDDLQKKITALEEQKVIAKVDVPTPWISN